MNKTSRRLLAIVAVAGTLAGASAAAALSTYATHQVAAPKQGIKVHGRWTIQVRRHGRVVRTRRFENALTQPGKWILASVLSRQASLDTWAVSLNTPNSVVGALLEPNVSHSSTCPCSNNLVVKGPSSANLASGGDLTLSGSVAAGSAATITDVNTFPSFCTSASDCSASTFTDKPGLSIPVQQGDTLNVKVVLSFS